VSPIDARPRASQWFAILAGLFLLDVGVLSLVTDGLSFADASHSASFVIWKASGWNTIGRIAIGALGLAACWRLSAARSYCILAAVAFGMLAIWGFADDGIETMGVFAFGTPGNVTHAVLALTAAAVTLTPRADGSPRRGSHSLTGLPGARAAPPRSRGDRHAR
jgi:Domain of unknown function (DUF4383)